MRSAADDPSPVDDGRLKRVSFRAPRQTQLHVVPVRWLAYEPYATATPIIDGRSELPFSYFSDVMR